MVVLLLPARRRFLQCSALKWFKKGALDQSRNGDLQTLVLMCGCAVSLSVMLLPTLAVAVPTPHDYMSFKESTVQSLWPQEGL